MLQKNNEALLQYVDEIKNLRSILLNDISGDANNNNLQISSAAAGAAGAPISGNRENILKKALKCKQLEDDNKKLRKLLKT